MLHRIPGLKTPSPVNTYSSVSDKEFISAIRVGGSASEAAIIGLYRRYRVPVLQSIRRLVFNHPGGKAEASDLMHDAFLVLIDKIRIQHTLPGSVPGYWYGIASYLWRNYRKRQGKILLVEDNEQIYGIESINPESIMLHNEESALMENLLQDCGCRCKKILTMWNNHYSMQEIADALGLAGAPIARQIKYRCFQKLKGLVMERGAGGREQGEKVKGKR